MNNPRMWVVGCQFEQLPDVAVFMDLFNSLPKIGGSLVDNFWNTKFFWLNR